ncbi:MAG TPA: UDP-N-acetylmuramate dehydrogenase [Patescibacteria group bacterium]|nr:UDP-N-acetylmuramate dehydrogenase [Patescibacteria group bacterium]
MQVYKNVSLSQDTYYHIGGNVDVVLELSSLVDIEEALKYLQQNHIEKILPLGLGSNLLISDSGFRGAILRLLPGSENFLLKENKVTAFAGATIDQLIQFCFSHNLAGLAWAGGLPSSVGGAIRGNAGAFGSEMKENVSSVNYIDLLKPELGIQTLNKEQCGFGYRDSFFKQHKNMLIVSGTFVFELGDEEEMLEQKRIYKENIAYRQSHHPMNLPSCGSVFKNITEKEKVEKIIAVWPDIKEKVETSWYGKVSMAYVIGRLGFSGFRVGDAQVSEKHNNYISNLSQAKASDVLAIIKVIKEKFITTFSFEPQLEVEVID